MPSLVGRAIDGVGSHGFLVALALLLSSLPLAFFCNVLVVLTHGPSRAVLVYERAIDYLVTARIILALNDVKTPSARLSLLGCLPNATVMSQPMVSLANSFA